MVRDQTRWMLDILEDPTRTGIVVVTTPEEMPINETVDLLGRLGRETNVAPSAGRGEPRPAGAVRSQGSPTWSQRLGDVEDRLVEAAGPGVRQVVVAAQLTEARRAVGAGHLERLRDGLPDRPSGALRPRAVHPGDRPACRRPRRRGARPGTGRGMSPSRSIPPGSTPCSRARRWCSSADRAASARRRSRRRWRCRRR